MSTVKKVLLIVTAGGLVLSTGCLSGNWWRWITAAASVAYDTTGTLVNVGAL